MRAFGYVAPRDPSDAVDLVAQQGGTFIAGGTDVLNLMRDGAESHDRIVDINGLALDDMTSDDTRLRIGALARMRQVGEDPGVVRDYPVVSQALLASASPQIRIMATIGGNLLQRTRCGYFRDPGSACNKRSPGSGCPAIEGRNRIHAVLGGSSDCIAVHPSDLAVSLVASDAVVHMLGPDGAREVAITDFYVRPGSTPQVETVLADDELITHVDVPRTPLAARSQYLKIRDRATFEFAVVSVAAGLDMTGQRVDDVRLAFGGIGTTPWRSVEAEDVLRGSRLTRRRIAAAGRVLVREAEPRDENGFKVELVQRALDGVLTGLGGLR